MNDDRLAQALAETDRYLNSPEALESLRRDPYWPKWHSPWWHMTLLLEMGMADRIPPPAARALLETVRERYVDFFPFTEAEIPAGRDSLRHIICHCALGNVYKILFACGFDVDGELPWARPWFLRYQLPDGGLNCDEAVYTCSSPRSSMLSTLPPLEAVLLCTPRPFTAEEVRFLEGGARYLLEHRLFRRVSDPSQIIDEAWTKLLFPRFYDYDVLRGLAFLYRFARTFSRLISAEAVREALTHVAEALDPATGCLRVGRRSWPQAKNLGQGADGQWSFGFPVSSFPLLEYVGRPGDPCPWLTPDLQAIRAALS